MQSGLKSLNIVPSVGLCVEGVRVDFKSPGTDEGHIFSIANCIGPDAPKTNVSRNALESPNARDELSNKIFQLYLDLAASEIRRLQEKENFSLTYATNQFPYIASALYPRSMSIQKKYTMFANFPLAIVEDDQSRSARSVTDIESIGDFWTVESNAIDSMMDLLQDARSDVTAKQVAERCGFRGEPMPSGAMLTNIRSNWLVKTLIDERFEISEMKASIFDRRLDVRWSLRSGDRSWHNSERAGGREYMQVYQELDDQRRMRGREGSRLAVAFPLSDVQTSGLEDFVAVSVLEKTTSFQTPPSASFLLNYHVCLKTTI